MASITVKPMTTSNTMPTLTGTVSFERFDANKNPKETIEVVINYRPYKLFETIGLDESVTPNVWKIQFIEPFYPGTYEIDARVINISTGEIIARDNTSNELTIIGPTQQDIARQNLNLIQRVALISALMGSVNKLFGGQNGIGKSPAVHPTLDDDSTTSLAGRADQERGEDARVKSKKKTAGANKVPLPPKKHPMAAVCSTDSDFQGSENQDFEPGNFDSFREQMGSTIDEANRAVRSSPDEAAAMNSQQYSTSTPTTVLG